MIIIIIILIIIIIILLFTRQEKKSTETHKKPGKYVNFDLLAGKTLKGY